MIFVKERGVVVAAAHCLFCLGDGQSLSICFTQFHDFYDLHKHMKCHIEKSRTPKMCPHSHCEDTLSSKSEFWTHATSIHGTPSFGYRRTFLCKYNVPPKVVAKSGCRAAFHHHFVSTELLDGAWICGED
jgi:hypothetical protein